MKVAELTIERIAAGGDGVGRDGELVVFVPRTAPQDRVRATLEIRKRFAKGIIDEVLIPSPLRVEPPCHHYRVDRCGGCQLQHIGYASQLEAKRGIVRDSLVRLAKRDVDAPPIEPSPRQWRYRRKLTLAMKRRRNGEWIIGLHPYDDPGRVFRLDDCPIVDEAVMSTWREVIAAAPHFPPADELRAFVQLTDVGAAVVMEGGTAWPKRPAFFAAVPSASSLWWKPLHQARALVGERGQGASASFSQINPEVGADLHAYVLERARAHEPKVVVDGYAGSGATAVPLARDGRRVVAIESDRAAASRCAAELPAGSSVIAARVEDAIERALPADVVLINPPRAGIHQHVAEVLQRAAPAPRAVIYVSCDPATLARDLARLPRYRIASLRSFDMFPQTAHVETVCELVPEAA